MADMALLAVRPPHEAKTRLAPALSPTARADFAFFTARHVLACLTAVLPPERCIIISRSAKILDLGQAAGAHVLVEEGHGQNAALTQGAGCARALGATGLLSISSDLPLLEADDVIAMVGGGARIAPDRHGRGTNALFMSPPLAFSYLHGANSLYAHESAARAAGTPLLRIVRRGLAHDVDTPEDLLPLPLERTIPR